MGASRPHEDLQPESLRDGVPVIGPGESSLEYTQIMIRETPDRMLMMVCRTRPDEISKNIRPAFSAIPDVTVLLSRHTTGKERTGSADL